MTGQTVVEVLPAVLIALVVIELWGRLRGDGREMRRIRREDRYRRQLRHAAYLAARRERKAHIRAERRAFHQARRAAGEGRWSR